MLSWGTDRHKHFTAINFMLYIQVIYAAYKLNTSCRNQTTAWKNLTFTICQMQGLLCSCYDSTVKLILLEKSNLIQK